MSKVTSVIPEDDVRHSGSTLFLILLITATKTMAWYADAFHSAENEGFNNLGLFRKNNIVDEYNKALRVVRADRTGNLAGNLEIIHLPTFQPGKI